MTPPRSLLFANLGRSTNADAVRRSWQSLATYATEHSVDFVVIVEVAEGAGDAADRRLMRTYFPPRLWTYVDRGGHEVLLVARKPDLIVRHSFTRWAGVAIRRQTPRRRVIGAITGTKPRDVVEAGPLLEVDGTHFAAGTHQQAKNRSPHIAGLLMRLSWLPTRAVLNRRRRNAARKGMHWIAAFDGNTRNLADFGLGDRAQVLAHRPASPDFVVGQAAPGWRIEVRDSTVVPTYIETLHQGLAVEFSFVRA